MQVSQSGPARTHLRRRPPFCMIVTAMIVAVSSSSSKFISNNTQEYSITKYNLTI